VSGECFRVERRDSIFKMQNAKCKIDYAELAHFECPVQGFRVERRALNFELLVLSLEG